MGERNVIRTGIIGATGYVGAELLRILLKHSGVEKIFTSSVSFEGDTMQAVYPNLLSFTGGPDAKYDGRLLSADEVLDASDVVFTALPHGLAEQYADRCLKTGKRLIDLSADFRYGEDEETFKTWYKKEWAFPETHRESVYGLPEMNRELIRNARIIGNPGCYVTSATLALLPALRANLADTSSVIVDSKSGITGAGRRPTMSNQFCECGESFSAYSVGRHRHQSEIQRNCSIIAGRDVDIIFTAHLLPINRGILSTVYVTLTDDAAAKVHADASYIRRIYEDAYKDEHFVRVLPEGIDATTRRVRASNFCDIQLYIVDGGRMLEIISCLDNMVKGAAGQAVQNMNIMEGFAESEAIDFVPAAF